MNKIETVVIIPNYNGELFLESCLFSVFNQKYQDFVLVFVDDKSSDNSVVFVENNFPGVDIIKNVKNIGFTKSINKAVLYSREKYNPKYIALLNNDTKVDILWLSKLKEKIESQKNIVSVTSNMLFMDNPSLINSQGGKCDFMCNGYDINYSVNISDIKEIKEKVLSPCFGACIIKTDAFDKIGLLDDRYLAYCEDLDWGIRANILGLGILFEKDAIVYHKGSASYGSNLFRKTYLCKRNSLCIMLKNYELVNLLRGILLIVFYYPVFFIGSLLNLKIKDSRFVYVYEDISLYNRLVLGLAPFLGVLWNIWNIKKTLQLRKNIQKRRLTKDCVVFSL